MLNSNLTQQEAQWLLEEYAPKRGGRIDGNTMDKYFVPARRLIEGKEIGRPGCGCHFKVFVSITNSMFGQHEAEIKNIAYPPKTSKRGRTKNGETQL